MNLSDFLLTVLVSISLGIVCGVFFKDSIVKFNNYQQQKRRKLKHFKEYNVNKTK